MPDPFAAYGGQAHDAPQTDPFAAYGGSAHDVTPPVQPTVAGSAGQRVLDTISGVLKTFDPRQAASALVHGDVADAIANTPIYRVAHGEVEAVKQAAPQAKQQFADAANPKLDPVTRTLRGAQGVVTSASILDPFATAPVANINQLESEGRNKEAIGQGITDAAVLAATMGAGRVIPKLAPKPPASLPDVYDGPMPADIPAGRPQAPSTVAHVVKKVAPLIAREVTGKIPILDRLGNTRVPTFTEYAEALQSRPAVPAEQPVIGNTSNAEIRGPYQPYQGDLTVQPEDPPAQPVQRSAPIRGESQTVQTFTGSTPEEIAANEERIAANRAARQKVALEAPGEAQSPQEAEPTQTSPGELDRLPSQSTLSGESALRQILTGQDNANLMRIAKSRGINVTKEAQLKPSVADKMLVDKIIEDLPQDELDEISAKFLESQRFKHNFGDIGPEAWKAMSVQTYFPDVKLPAAMIKRVNAAIQAAAPQPAAVPPQAMAAAAGADAPIPEELVQQAPNATETQEPAPTTLQPERRTNVDLRKAIDSMSPDEQVKAIYQDETTGAPNRRAFDWAEQHYGPAKSVAMTDADGLKAFNDKYGHEAGDAMLQAKANALKEAGLEYYRGGKAGDEFLARGTSDADLSAKLEKARDILRNTVIRVQDSEGNFHDFMGADFSHGAGADLKTAEQNMYKMKQARKASGDAPDRGEFGKIKEVRK